MPGQAFGTTQTTLDDQPSQQAVSRGVARPQSLLRAPPSWIRIVGAKEPGNSQQHASNGRRLHGVKPTAVRSTDSSPVARRYSASSAISMRPTATARLTRSVQPWRRGPPRDRGCPQAGSAGGGLGAGRAIRPGCRRRGAFDSFGPVAEAQGEWGLIAHPYSWVPMMAGTSARTRVCMKGPIEQRIRHSRL